MTYRIRTIDYTAAGREIVREREVEGDTITIGRASTNAVHLPDLAVEQEHVRISPAPGGGLRLSAVGNLGFTLDGRSLTAAQVNPASGAELALGSYLLDIAAEGGVTTITVQRAPDDEGERDRLAGFALASALPGKRAMAWIGLAVILLAFLAIPIASHLTRERVKPQMGQSGHVIMDASWSPGPLSAAHHGLEKDCEACHVNAFEAVRDQTCLACHGDVTNHAPHNRLVAAMGPPGVGEAIQRGFAHAFGKPGPGACVDCHVEHEGSGPMPPTQQKFCADCHATLDQRLTDTKIGNASDFGKLHPQFTALALPSPQAPRAVPISLEGHPQAYDGLRFSHEDHLNTTGGVAQMAITLGSAHGYGAPLQCADCHTPTADGSRFLPVSMEKNCEACHSLVYDKVGNTYRRLTHGDSAQAYADLMAGDRSPRGAVTSLRPRPGKFSSGSIYYNNFAPVPASLLLAKAMDKDGLCGECHLPGNRADGPLAVAPVTQNTRFMMHGWFDHSFHKQEKCTSCHAAETSTKAMDLLLPGIKTCRECHAGESTVSAVVPSGCAMCHVYHPRQGPAAAPPPPVPLPQMRERVRQELTHS